MQVEYVISYDWPVLTSTIYCEGSGKNTTVTDALTLIFSCRNLGLVSLIEERMKG